MPVNTLKAFLDNHKVPYVSIVHSSAYTSQQVAESAHISGKEMAKTVIVKINGKMAMVVTPSNTKLNFDDLKKKVGSDKVELATEGEFADKFPGCELGAMPPFGNLYNMDVYVTHGLSLREHIAFNAGTHSEVIRLAYKDFESLVQPKILA
jgi:Ala-tRNA(Pro) deacylase